jgi:hypothetical protein
VAAIIELLVAATLAQDARPAEDGVERRAQLVGDQSNELVLRPVGALGLATSLSLSRQRLFESLLGLLSGRDVSDTTVARIGFPLSSRSATTLI